MLRVGSAWNTSPEAGSTLTACASSAAPAGVSTVGVAAATAGVTPSGNTSVAAATNGSHNIRRHRRLTDDGAGRPGCGAGVAVVGT